DPSRHHFFTFLSNSYCFPVLYCHPTRYIVLDNDLDISWLQITKGFEVIINYRYKQSRLSIIRVFVILNKTYHSIYVFFCFSHIIIELILLNFSSI
ncbi:hypothetical protein L9F63_002804, partial [Diploptera punctata]